MTPTQKEVLKIIKDFKRKNDLNITKGQLRKKLFAKNGKISRQAIHQILTVLRLSDLIEIEQGRGSAEIILK